MKRTGKTAMGGVKSVFQTTHWSVVRAAGSLESGPGRAAIDCLIRTYWRPVYSYLRRRGYGNEQAKDLTQGFFHEVVLGRRLALGADQRKGRFRTLLLTSLDRYVTSAYRKQTAAKRRPKAPVVSLQDFDESRLPVETEAMRPDDMFTYMWASGLVQDVLAQVEAGCRRDGKTKHWQLFAARVVEPIATDADAPSLSQLAERIGIESTVKAENMIVTVKRRFRAVLRHRVRQGVGSEAEVEQEIRDLMAILSGSRK